MIRDTRSLLVADSPRNDPLGYHGTLCCRSSAVAVTPMIYPHRTLAGSPVPRRSAPPFSRRRRRLSGRVVGTPDPQLLAHTAPPAMSSLGSTPSLAVAHTHPHFCRRYLTPTLSSPCRHPSCRRSPLPPHLRLLTLTSSFSSAPRPLPATLISTPISTSHIIPRGGRMRVRSLRGLPPDSKPC